MRKKVILTLKSFPGSSTSNCLADYKGQTNKLFQIIYTDNYFYSKLEQPALWKIKIYCLSFNVMFIFSFTFAYILYFYITVCRFQVNRRAIMKKKKKKCEHLTMDNQTNPPSPKLSLLVVFQTIDGVRTPPVSPVVVKLRQWIALSTLRV